MSCGPSSSSFFPAHEKEDTAQGSGAAGEGGRGSRPFPEVIRCLLFISPGPVQRCRPGAALVPLGPSLPCSRPSPPSPKAGETLCKDTLSPAEQRAKL